MEVNKKHKTEFYSQAGSGLLLVSGVKLLALGQSSS